MTNQYTLHPLPNPNPIPADMSLSPPGTALISALLSCTQANQPFAEEGHYFPTAVRHEANLDPGEVTALSCPELLMHMDLLFFCPAAFPFPCTSVRFFPCCFSFAVQCSKIKMPAIFF